MSGDEMTLCMVMECNRPSDGWIVCRTCGNRLQEHLRDAGWMLDELDLVMSQQTRYADKAHGKSAETALAYNAKASEAYTALVHAIGTSARLVADHNGWDMDASTAVGTADWLERRIASVRLHVGGGDMYGEIMSAWKAAIQVIDRPAARQYLGQCEQDPEGVDCGGRIYGREGKPHARCDTCGGIYEAEALRTYLVRELEAKLLTAAEIARLSTYLGLHMNREQVRKRINQWHTRKHLVSHQDDKDDAPMFLVKEVLALLHREQERIESKSA